jgi:hypothetical protein
LELEKFGTESKNETMEVQARYFDSQRLSKTIFPMSAAVGPRESEGKVGRCTQCQRRHYVKQSLQRDENTYFFAFPKYKTSAHTLTCPKLLKWFE